MTCLKILPQQIQEIVDLVGQHQEKAPEFLDLLNIIVKVEYDSFPLGVAFPIIFLLHVALSTPLPAFQISLAHVFPSCFQSSFLSFSLVYPFSTLSSVCVHHMPVPVQSSFGDLFGSLRHSHCSSDIRCVRSSSCLLCHIHHSIPISFTSIRFSCIFVVAHVSASYSIAGLITVLQTFHFCDGSVVFK